eukprot:10164639-Prorocentrum_lima.AAC.1
MILYVGNRALASNASFHNKVTDRLQKDFVADSVDVDDIMFIDQRPRWIDKGQITATIQLDQ